MYLSCFPKRVDKKFQTRKRSGNTQDITYADASAPSCKAAAGACPSADLCQVTPQLWVPHFSKRFCTPKAGLVLTGSLSWRRRVSAYPAARDACKFNFLGKIHPVRTSQSCAPAQSFSSSFTPLQPPGTTGSLHQTVSVLLALLTVQHFYICYGFKMNR